MINSENLLKFFLKKEIKFFAGVPDSCTNEFCNALNKNKKVHNIVTANEGVAISLGIGYFLSTKKIACIYLQNSGLGNAIDPLTSLSNKEVYKIPLMLMIGWRGAPGIKDEAQHDVQGRILLKSLKLLGIKYLIINKDRNKAKIESLIKYAKKNSRCVALILKPKNLTKVNRNSKKFEEKLILRKNLIESLLKNTSKNSKIISSVGFNSRELCQIRSEKNFKNGRDFLMVGAMGHTSSVSLAISKFNKNNTICLDGDGSFIMHLGSLTLVGNHPRKNFKYIMVDNGSHESIGNQYIDIGRINIKKLSESLGFKNFFYTKFKKNLDLNMKKFLNSKGPSFFHVKIQLGTLKNLVRPKKFEQIKRKFMQ